MFRAQFKQSPYLL